MKTKVASVVAGIVNGGILSISLLIVHSSVLGSGNVNIVFYSKTFLLLFGSCSAGLTRLLSVP
jgi:hypothetical protein